jgi:hypothetical protein
MTWTFLLFALFALTACTGLTIQGEGNMTTESRDVEGFDEVDVCCGMRLVVAQGEGYSLEIQGLASVLPEIRTRVDGSRLVVDVDDFPLGIVTIEGPVTVYVTAPEFTALSSSGGGRIEASKLDAERLALDLSGGGRAAIESLVADELTVGLSGGSQMELAGRVDTQEIDASGGSKFLASDLQSAEARVDASGGGRAELWVTDSLDVSASGGSQIEYYGGPQVISDTSGGSQVKSLGERTGTE